MTPDDLTIAESNLRIAAANYEHTRRGQDAAFAEACSTLLQAARNFVDAERGEAKIEAEYGNFAALYDQIGKWSVETFGPGDRSDAVVAHIRKELMEIEATPSDVTEWVDVAILAMDGARRSAGADGAALRVDRGHRGHATDRAAARADARADVPRRQGSRGCRRDRCGHGVEAQHRADDRRGGCDHRKRGELMAKKKVIGVQRGTDTHRWFYTLECGHQVWVTSKSRPSARSMRCDPCDRGVEFGTCDGWPAEQTGNRIEQGPEVTARAVRRLQGELTRLVKASAAAAERRAALPAGSSRARVTTANARWMRLAEARDRVALELAKLLDGESR